MRFLPNIFLAGFLCVVAVIGVWRINRPISDAHIERMGTGSIVLEGRIADAPEIGDTSIAYVVSDLRVASGSTLLEGRVLVRDRGMWPRYAYGETVRLMGKLEIAEHVGFGKLLRTRGIQTTMFGPRITSIAPAPLSTFGLLVRFREMVEGRIRLLFPEPAASLAVGLLTGTRASFPDSLTEALRTSGLTHITAVSGSNVAIVLALFDSLLFWVPRRWRIGPLCIGLFLFVLFTGASASVIRAGIMGALSILALHAGRMSQARRTIAWTAGFMLLWNPWLLTGDLGFQLSFLSVIGILEVSPYLASLLKRIPNVLALRESIALTLSSQITAGPWIAYALGNLSLVALPANLLAAPLIPWAMLFGFVATLSSLIGLGLPVAFIGQLPLSGIIAVAEGSAALPYASVDGLQISAPVIIGYYILLFLVLVWLAHKKSADPMKENSGL